MCLHMKPNTIRLYDTTLRDGAQGEGIHFSLMDKLHIAQRLDSFGMHYIEGGWPSNPKDIEFFERAQTLKLKQAKLVAFGSTRRPGVTASEDTQVQQLIQAQTPVVAIVGKTWKLHVQEVLRTTLEENLAMIRDTVRFLKSKGREVVYDSEHAFDAYKDDAEYALACWQAAQEGGADWVVLCDTNGGSLPTEVLRITKEVATKLKNPVGIHTHNDSELAVANALAAVTGGATQIHGTINGFGERVGNCNLISVIPNLQLKMGFPVLSNEQLAQLRELSLFVDEIANQRHNPRAPFVGDSAFAHKGGIHVNAVNKVSRSYEHISPETIGARQRVLVGELSGGANIMIKARELGITLDEKAPETRAILKRVKHLENEGYEFEAADASFELLVRKELQHHAPFFKLIEYHVSIRNLPDHAFNSCEATVKISVNDEKCYTVAEGDGPVNALDTALRQALVKFYPKISCVALIDYKVRILNSTTGSAARTRVLIESSDGEHNWSTVGVSDNIIEASWLALVDSLEYWFLKAR